MSYYFRRLVPPVSGWLAAHHSTSGSSSHHRYESVDAETAVSQPNLFILQPELGSVNLKSDDCELDTDIGDTTTDIENNTTVKEVCREGSVKMDPLLEADSDNEDDPTKLLNQWLGELNSLKKVTKSNILKGGSLRFDAIAYTH